MFAAVHIPSVNNSRLPAAKRGIHQYVSKCIKHRFMDLAIDEGLIAQITALLFFAKN